MQAAGWAQSAALHSHVQWSPKETCSPPAVAVRMAQGIWEAPPKPAGNGMDRAAFVQL